MIGLMNYLKKQKNNFMKLKNLQYFLFILVFCSACSVQKYLPENEKLYRGAEVKIVKNAETKTSTKALKKTTKLAVVPAPNKFLLGQPYKVWWWYKIGEPKKEKGLKSFLRKKLGEPPIFSSQVNTKSGAENIQSLLQNLGYFHSTAIGDTEHVKKYMLKAKYNVNVEPQYTIAKIDWIADSSGVVDVLKEDNKKNGLLKIGAPYRLSDVTTERDRLDLFLKTKGYYYFSPNYLMSYIDSTVGNRKVNVFLNLKKITPTFAKQVYSVNDIVIYPSFSLTNKKIDTASKAIKYYNDLKIIDSTNSFKPKLFQNVITFKKGELYNSATHNATLNRLIGLGTFKFVKSTYKQVIDSTNLDSTQLLNVNYFLVPNKRKAFQAQLDGTTKENNFLGTQLSLFWKNNNLLKGAEQLGVKVYGGYETSTRDTIRINNLRVGTELSLTIPKYVIPFIRVKENNFYPPKTTFLLGFEWFKKDIFFTKNLFRFQYDFTFKPKLQTQFTISPISVSYLKATNISDTFRKEIVKNPALQLSVFNEVILGSYASYTYSPSLRNTRNKSYFKTSIEASGNIAGLITGAKLYRQKNIFGVPFAQYVKLDFDYHFTKTFKSNLTLANRLQVGIGLPYNNSKLLPYAKLYNIGGSNSIRGFRSLTLGPGSYKPTINDQQFFQIIGGDYKLLANTELRIPFTKQLSSAIFIDAGNIWTKDTTLFGSAAQLTKSFLKQTAVATGVGLRFDATILLVRFDLGIPIRKPFLQEGQRWVIDEINFGSKAWRRENLVLNIAIGLPF
jgi:outer membrane protein insertion porin family